MRAYKISKRQEDDISAVCAVFNLALDENSKVLQLKSGFGGVAATPASVDALSDAIKGKDWSKISTFELGKKVLSESFTPLDDVRASAEYRQALLVNLFKRFWLQTNQQSQQIETRVHAYE